MSEIERHASENVSIMLLGNKNDKIEERQVTFEEGKELADRYNVLFLETSSKYRQNVNTAFILMAREIKLRIDIEQAKQPLLYRGGNEAL